MRMNVTITDLAITGLSIGIMANILIKEFRSEGNIIKDCKQTLIEQGISGQDLAKLDEASKTNEFKFLPYYDAVKVKTAYEQGRLAALAGSTNAPKTVVKIAETAIKTIR